MGKSHTISLKEMIYTIENELNKKAKIKNFPFQQGNVEKTYADITKGKKIYRLCSKIDFNEGIKIYKMVQRTGKF